MCTSILDVPVFSSLNFAKVESIAGLFTIIVFILPLNQIPVKFESLQSPIPHS